MVDRPAAVTLRRPVRIAYSSGPVPRADAHPSRLRGATAFPTHCGLLWDRVQPSRM
ncbi:hypothetical protein ACSS6W_000018 [Trichoderma asperelloides]